MNREQIRREVLEEAANIAFDAVFDELGAVKARKLQTQIRALAASQPAPVAAQATPEMIRAGIDALNMPWDSVIPPGIDRDEYILAMVWTAMHDARPAADTGQAVAWRWWCPETEQWYLVTHCQHAPSNLKIEALVTLDVDNGEAVERLTRERDDAVARYADAVKDASEQRALAERRRKTILQYMNEAHPAPLDADTGQAVAFERAGSDDAKLGWTLPVSLLQQVNQKVIADDWEDPTIEVTEIILLEAERLLSSHPAPLDAERVREDERDRLLKWCDETESRLKDCMELRASEVEFGVMWLGNFRAALRQKEGKA